MLPFVAEVVTINRQNRVKISILEMLCFTAIVGLIAAVWRTGQDRGMVIAIISATCIAYYFNRLRTPLPLLPTTLIALPIVAIGVFVFSLALGLRHPPFMVPPGWKWPPFATFHERVTHAFALSVWTFIFGMPIMILLGTLRRIVGASTTTPKSATNNPMDRSGGSAAS